MPHRAYVILEKIIHLNSLTAHLIKIIIDWLQITLLIVYLVVRLFLNQIKIILILVIHAYHLNLTDGSCWKFGYLLLFFIPQFIENFCWLYTKI